MVVSYTQKGKQQRTICNSNNSKNKNKNVIKIKVKINKKINRVLIYSLVSPSTHTIHNGAQEVSQLVDLAAPVQRPSPVSCGTSWWTPAARAQELSPLIHQASWSVDPRSSSPNSKSSVLQAQLFDLRSLRPETMCGVPPAGRPPQPDPRGCGPCPAGPARRLLQPRPRD